MSANSPEIDKFFAQLLGQVFEPIGERFAFV